GGMMVHVLALASLHWLELPAGPGRHSDPSVHGVLALHSAPSGQMPKSALWQLFSLVPQVLVAVLNDPPLLKQSRASMQLMRLPLTVAVMLPGQAALQAVKMSCTEMPVQVVPPPLTMQCSSAAGSCGA